MPLDLRRGLSSDDGDIGGPGLLLREVHRGVRRRGARGGRGRRRGRLRVRRVRLHLLGVGRHVGAEIGMLETILFLGI